MINNEMMLLYGGVGIAIFFILMIFYIYIKDKESARRLARYEKSIEDLNKEVYRLQKKIKENAQDLESFKNTIKGQMYQDIRLEIKNILDSNLSLELRPLQEKIQGFDGNIRDFTEEIRAKMMELEERLREFAYTPTTPTNIDEGRIISMFKDGWSVDSIAKELRIGKGEVEFTLRFANLK